MWKVAVAAALGSKAETRVVVIGLDTSHSIAFTKVINVDRPQWGDSGDHI
jgi:hypothetical protein